VRAITAERMALSARSVARVTLFAETDFSEAVRFRKQLGPEFERRWGAKLSYDAMIAKACGLALAEYPDLNSVWADGALQRNVDANVGIALQTERGLLVAVLRNVDRRPLYEVAGDAADMVQRALSGALRPAEMSGGTFTITNLGSFGVDAFTPIVNPPEAAILGIGRIAARAVVAEGQLAARETAWLTLSFDHRVADGVPAAQFLQRIKTALENPYILLA
jgi:pyruvate dehydrogenase E2 component (dihydrolipoamide acetyltransferase)